MRDLNQIIPYFFTFLLGFLVWLILRKWSLSRRAKRHLHVPPVVPGLLVLGNSHQLNPTAPYKTFRKFAKRYGDIYSLYLWGQEVVIVNSYDLLYDALVKESHAFAGRPYSFRLSAMNGFGHELVFADLSSEWIQKKKVAQQVFSHVGNNNPAWEEASQGALDTMLQEMDKVAVGSVANEPNGVSEGMNGGQKDKRLSSGNMLTFSAVDLKIYLETCAVQSISYVLFGRKMEEDEYMPLFPIIEEGTTLMNPAGPGAELDLLPGLWYLYYLIPFSSYWRLVGIWERQRTWMEDIVRRTQELRETGEIETTRCMFDVLVEESGKQTKPDHVYSRDDIIATVGTILTGGVHPVSTLVYTLIGLVVNHKEVQKKVHKELHEVLGKRKPCLCDQSSLPYCRALITETMRYTSTAPLIMRKVITDVKLGGYDIAKETIVLANLFSIHHDERHWDDPWTFKPERFLDEQGNFLPSKNNIKGYMPYGAGRRLCTGQAMAQNQVFLLVSSLLRRYTFTADHSSPAPDMDPRSYTPGLVPQPTPFRVKISINPWS